MRWIVAYMKNMWGACEQAGGDKLDRTEVSGAIVRRVIKGLFKAKLLYGTDEYVLKFFGNFFENMITGGRKQFAQLKLLLV